MLRHLTFANVCSALALTIALGGGTAYAASTIKSKDIVNGQVKTPDLGKNAVTSAKIRNGQVRLADLAAGAVTGTTVADGTITLADLAAGTIPPPTTIGDGSITELQLADGSVSTAKLQENSINAGKLQTDSVGATEISDNSIDGGELVDNSIFAADLGADSVTASELANNSVDAANVINDSLTFSDIDGGGATGSISLPAGSVPDGECENVAIGIGGATVGDAVVFSVQDALPEGVLMYGVRVTATNSMTALACNFTGGAMPAVSNVSVRILTFH
ncbi:hypothetical protein GCM10009795_015790 [Nocardioides hankookensis]|uniref:Pentapeptide repeat-containing protein n=1 Tax=Nocardioides hankookensis TaxID=443157 RepID=A0ABW1LJ63_9ACTN